MIDLRQGDCLELLKDIPDASVDMVMTDMPYGTTQCKWDTVVDLDALWIEIKRIAKPNAAIVMTAAQPFTSVLITSNLKMFRYDVTWDKKKITGFLSAKRMPLRKHEDICVFYRKLPTYNPQMTYGSKKTGISSTKTNTVIYGGVDRFSKYGDDGSRYPTSIISDINGVINNSGEKVAHPTQKPVALMKYLIKTYTNEHDVVIDMFMGSGSTGVACVKTNRRFIGIELDPDYFAIAEERINQAAENSGFLMPII